MSLFRNNRRREPETGQQNVLLSPKDEVEDTGSQYRTTLHPRALSEGRLPELIRTAGSQGANYGGAFFPAPSFDDPLGLYLFYQPQEIHGNLIFVHGLSGTSLRSWSHERNPALFWPKWLAQDPQLSKFRMFSYGYDASLLGPKTSANITDFAKALLLNMWSFHSGRNEEHVAIENHPIIFIAHSMGGLIVKKAFIMGRSDSKYSEMVSHIYGVIFLGTPHKGADSVSTLNLILSASPFVTSPKLFLGELELTSNTLQDMNDQFRTTCGGLQLVSFYETLPTSLGPGHLNVRKIVVKKDSSMLGLSHEISAPLKADHHTISKFRSPDDPNYITLRNTLKKFAEDVSPYNHSSPTSTAQNLRNILSVDQLLDEDLNMFRTGILPTSCHWFVDKYYFQDWLCATDTFTKVLWITGPPGTGKSTIAGFLIEHMQEVVSTDRCQYHFFHTSDEKKRTVAYMLRSIALQLAQYNETVRQSVFSISEESRTAFDKLSPSKIWDKLFVDSIFKIAFDGPLYWILDALDEADNVSILVALIRRMKPVTPIRLLLLSRPSYRPMQEQLPPNGDRDVIFTYQSISVSDTQNDIRTYVHDTIRDSYSLDQEFRDRITNQILGKARGSFLWVRLVLNTLRGRSHTEADIQKALEEIPEGMEPMFQQMVEDIRNESLRNQDIAKRILTWAACSYRPLSIAELEIALKPEYTGFVSLEKTIMEICGHFVSLEKSHIWVIHSTAKHFLLHGTDQYPAFIEGKAGHKHIALVCLAHLSNASWKRALSMAPEDADDLPADPYDNVTLKSLKKNRLRLLDHEYPFLAYTAIHWARHVTDSKTPSDDLIIMLNQFFDKFCLSWINAIALSGNLRPLITASECLKSFVRLSIRQPSRSSEKPSVREDLEDISHWATDLARLVGKFGRNLVQNPASIYRHIPPFCPQGSMIQKTYGRSSGSGLFVTGISSSAWDDCLAQLSVGEERVPSKVFCTETHFMALIERTGTIVVWDAETCERIRTLEHRHRIRAMALNKAGTLVAVAGHTTVEVWRINTGESLHHYHEQNDGSIIAIVFSNGDTEVVLGHDDCSIVCISLERAEEEWIFSAEEATDNIQGSPRILEFSPDATMVALAFRGRGKPLVVWDTKLADPQRPPRSPLVSMGGRAGKGKDTHDMPQSACWSPDGAAIFIMYQGSSIVYWNIIDDEQKEYSYTGARHMTISQDGLYLLTSDYQGTLTAWSLPGMGRKYQLNHDEFIRGLALSPDRRRIYDTRGSCCNIWESEALMPALNDEADDNTGSTILSRISTMSDTVYAHDNNNQSQVTALAGDSGGLYFCCGRDDGTVTIHSINHGRKIRKVYSHASTVSIILLRWSNSGRYMVSADDSGRVIVKRLDPKDPGKWAVYPLLDFREIEPVQQFLFNEQENLLLVSTLKADMIWRLKPKSEEPTCRHRYSSRQSRRWVNHPYRPDVMLWIAPTEMKLYRWSDLCHVQSHSLTSDLHDPSSIILMPRFDRPLLRQKTINIQSTEESEAVRKVYLVKNGRYIISEIHSDNDSRCATKIELIPLESIDNSGPNSPQSPTSPPIFGHEALSFLPPTMTLFISVYHDHIVFLDRHSWICTWQIDGQEPVKPHFFLPRDWVDQKNLGLAWLNDSGQLLCPKLGEVAIVHNGIII
ncbi:hypothetical protein MMC11_001449 [Xylographa trunciseda]|nr:hypothetical protein [Xylographa trunciseda]